ncbi:MAG: hypothetical protein GF334_13360 [Candidatus Altiarchaeales archaeon]|nr:hypothetical protein [Candidatus Altiarchaeales archaeon]
MSHPDVHVSPLTTKAVKDFTDCQQLWLWRHGLGYAPREPNKRTLVRALVRAGLSTYYAPEAIGAGDGTVHRRMGFHTQWNTRALIDGLTQAADGLLAGIRDRNNGLLPPVADEAFELAVGVLEQYGRWAPKNDEFSVVAVNHPVVAVVAQGISLVDTVDLVLGSSMSEPSLVMLHRLYSSIPSGAAHMQHDFRAHMLMWAASEDAQFPLRVRSGTPLWFNEIRKAVPSPPRTLKSGELSKDKRQNTTRELYIEEISRRGLSPSDYHDIIEALDPNKFNTRHWLYVDDDMLDYVHMYVHAVASRMALCAETEGAWQIIHEWGSRCSYCDYLDLCQSLRHMQCVRGLLSSRYFKWREDNATNEFGGPVLGSA